MYSPAALPSSTRAAPAKKRIWSTIGGSSSDAVRASGLPVFCDSAATISSARASIASAMRSSARCRTDGVASRQTSKARCRRVHRTIDVGRLGHRRGGKYLPSARVDDVAGHARLGVDVRAIDEIAQHSASGGASGSSGHALSPYGEGADSVAGRDALAGDENVSDIGVLPLIPWMCGACDYGIACTASGCGP